jgi:hypothetical protein
MPSVAPREIDKLGRAATTLSEPASAECAGMDRFRARQVGRGLSQECLDILVTLEKHSPASVTQVEIGEDCNLSRKTVGNYLKRLRDANLTRSNGHKGENDHSPRNAGATKSLRLRKLPTTYALRSHMARAILSYSGHGRTHQIPDCRSDGSTPPRARQVAAW